MAEREFLGGVTNTTLHFETDGTMHVEEKQDVEPILDYCKAARNNRFNADAMDGMMQHAAEIPMVVFIDECRLRGITPFASEIGDNMVIELIMADPKYAHFLAAPKQRDPRIRMKGLR